MKSSTVLKCAVTIASLFAAGLAFLYFKSVSNETGRKTSIINQDSTSLILALQHYREAFNSYPQGDTLSIMREIFGGNSLKKSFIESSADSRSMQGELLDPWRIPYRIFTSGERILIQSAGPDKTFSTYDQGNSGDDIFRSL